MTTVSGILRDAKGMALPGVAVTLRYVPQVIGYAGGAVAQNNLTYLTNSAGLLSMPGLVAGPYNLSIAMPIGTSASVTAAVTARGVVNGEDAQSLEDFLQATIGEITPTILSQAIAAAEAAAASAAAAALFDPDNFQPINARLTALSGLPAPAARAAVIGTASGGYTNRGRARRVIFEYGQSNISNSDAKNWTPPPNLFVWDGGIGGAVGTAFVPCPSTVMRVPYAHVARIAEQDPDTDYYLVACATGGTGLRAVVGMDYVWSGLTSGDPGAGAVALDAGGDAIHYSETDANGYLRFFGTTSLDRTTDTGGLARIEVIADPTIYVTLDVTGAYVDGGAYRSQACTISASATWPPAPGTPVRLYPAKQWLREVIRVNCEAAMAALGLTGADRRFDQVLWWHTESDAAYDVSYGARDFDAVMAFIGQWTDASTVWTNVLPWPHATTSVRAIQAWWEVIRRKCAENSTQRKVVSLEATSAADWGDSGNVHIIGADAKACIGRLIADAAAFGGSNFSYESGSWTPTVTLGSNVAAASALGCYYQRVGDAVHVYGRINVTSQALNANTIVTLTLPVASDLVAGEGGGVVASDRQEVGVMSALYSDGASRLRMTWKCSVIEQHAITFSGMYMIR